MHSFEYYNRSDKQKRSVYLSKIKLEYIDELNRLSSDLCAIAYSQGLVNQDEFADLFVGKYNFIREAAKQYLWDREEESALNLKAILEKKDFTVSVK